MAHMCMYSIHGRCPRRFTTTTTHTHTHTRGAPTGVKRDAIDRSLYRSMIFQLDLERPIDDYHLSFVRLESSRVEVAPTRRPRPVVTRRASTSARRDFAEKGFGKRQSARDARR